MESSPRFGDLPLPPPLPASIPAKRIQTQLQEAPACVQNAMMTKDKKPFTYTPGGIDLSQIKSPRMARRLEQNANCEGVTNVPKMSPLAQPSRTNQPSSLPSGMPVQVFPTGPPVGPPAPPPPPPKQPPSNDTNNINGTQRSDKTPVKSFEPPPMGCRPEIKIPPNPMATLKPAPKPQLKNDFWVEEYRKERSKSPLVQKEDQNNQSQNEPPNIQEQLGPQNNTSSNSPSQNVEQRPITPKRQWSPLRTATPATESPTPQLHIQNGSMSPSLNKSNTRVESPFSSQPNPLLPKPLTPVKVETVNNVQAQGQKPPEEILTRQQRELIHQQEVQDQIRRQQRWQQQPQNTQQNESRQQQQLQQQQQQQLQHQQQLKQQQQQLQQQQIQQQQQLQQQRQLQQQQQLQQQKQQQIQQQQQQQQHQREVPIQQQFKKLPERDVSSQPVQNINVGAFNMSPAHSDAFSLLTQETPQWMAKRGNNKETPEWVDRDDSSVNAAANANKFVFKDERSQQNSHKERIIPIQLERTPPVSTNSGFEYPQGYSSNQNNSNFGGNPLQNNANKFVDQGYSSFAPPNADEASKFTINTQSTARGTRTVPIQIEGQTNPFTVTLSDSKSQAPIVLQNDPRTLDRQTSWGNSTPNQSKSFRVLQKIADQEFENANMPAQLQSPHYSKPLGPADMNENQLRKLQLNENEMKRFKNNAQGTPSNEADNNVVTSRPARRFNQQHAVFQPEDQSQNTYQADPKLYTGSSIPSRSFKILQAMVTPENAAEDQTSDIESQVSCKNKSNSFEIPYDTPYEYDNPYSDSEHIDASDSFRASTQVKLDENSLSSKDMPRIVVTPTPEDELRLQYEAKNLEKNLQNEIESRNAFEMLSQKLQSMAQSTNDNYDSYSENKDYSKQDTNSNRRLTPITECSSSSSNCNISSLETDTSDDESDIESDEKDMVLCDRTPSLKRFNSSLQVGNSFASIKVNSQKSSESSDDDEDSEESEEDEVQDESQLDKKSKEDNENKHTNGLGVIMEEEESLHQKIRPRTNSFNSTSTLSDSTAKDDYPQTKDIAKPVTMKLSDKNADLQSDTEFESEYEEVTETEYEEVTETEYEEETAVEENEEKTDKDDVTKQIAKEVTNDNNETETEYEEETDEEDTEYEEETDCEENEDITDKDVKETFVNNKKDAATSGKEIVKALDSNLDKMNNEKNRDSKSEGGKIRGDSDEEDDEEDEDEEEEESEEESEEEEEEEEEHNDGLNHSIFTGKEEEAKNYSDISVNVEVKLTPTKAPSNFSLNTKDISNKDNKCLELSPNKNEKHHIQPSVSENDVSVSFSIPSRSSSTEHNSWHSKASSLDVSSSRPSIEYEDSDSEVSVNIVLHKRGFDKEKSNYTAKPANDIETNNRKLNTTIMAEDTSTHKAFNSNKNSNENIKSSVDSIKADSDDKSDEIVCVREKIAIFESSVPFKKVERTPPSKNSNLVPPSMHYLNPVAEIKTPTKKLSLDESELEDDSGVTSDISRPDTDTESECFVELRKLTRYQRAATHSRLFKLLQGDNFDEDEGNEPIKPQERTRIPYKPKKIVHNVSITRRNNPNAINEVESHAQRRQRLSLHFNESSSIDNDNASTSPSSPVNEKLVKELVQSILKKEGKTLQNIPASKLHAAAKRVLQEDLDSLDNTCSSSSFESTPVLTPQEFRNDYSNMYSDYYDSWDNDNRQTYDILPSKAFKNLRDQSICGRKRQLWAARCPRVLSSKNVNRDLSQLTEHNEPHSPDPYIPYTSQYKSTNRLSEAFKITNDE